MQSRMILPRCRIHSSQGLRSIGYATSFVLGGVGLAASSAHAVPALAHSPHLYLNQGGPIAKIVVVRRGRAAVGPRGGAVVRRSTVVRLGVRPMRPSWYRWPPGGAIAADAAIGFVTAGTAAAWAGTPPAPGYCRCYTDPSQRRGFWDVCQ